MAKTVKNVATEETVRILVNTLKSKVMKDLALTWYEVANLTAIVGMLNNTDFNGNVFEEALRRFNEQRKNK